MNIFEGYDLRAKESIKELKKHKCKFTPLQNSTSSVEGQFSNVEFNEKDLIEYLICHGNIVSIDCNFGHLTAQEYKKPAIAKKSNRGRKKKQKTKKKRKHQGDGTCFNSQINFTVLGTIIREKPQKNDIYSATAESIDNLTEKIKKPYKIKIFRNGKFTVPGVLREDLSDLNEPLEELREYFEFLMGDTVSIKDKETTMRNYKFLLKHDKIDLTKLYELCYSKFTDLININLEDLYNSLIEPYLIREKHEVAISKIGWAQYAYINEGKRNIIDFNNMLAALKNSAKNKVVHVKKERLIDLIKKAKITKIYSKFELIVDHFENSVFKISREDLLKILGFMIFDEWNEIKNSILNHNDNKLASVKYDPENFPGLLMYIRTPVKSTKKKNANLKRTTVKIFKQKINIDGANNRKEAELIYWWLNKLIDENENALYNLEKIHEADNDSEFSDSGEDNGD